MLLAIEPAAAVFLFVLCIFVPYLALKSRQRLGDGPLPVSRTRLFVQTIFVQLWLFALAVMAAVRNGIDLLAAPPCVLRVSA